MFVLIISTFASSNHDRCKEYLPKYVQNVCMTCCYGVSGVGKILTKNLNSPDIRFVCLTTNWQC